MPRATLALLLFIPFSLLAGQPSVSSEGDGDHKISPPYVEAPEMKPKPGTPIGDVKEFVMNSTDSKIYPGVKGPYQRKVAVYIPKQYKPGTEAPFIVAHDGLGYRGTLLPALDSLIAAKKVPVMIAILVNSGGGDGPGSQRGLEYDTVSGVFTSFIETEVLPRVAKDYNIVLTKNPEGRATMGGSSGGSAAFTMGWFHPELYRRILTYSGTYVNQQSPKDPKFPHGAWEYHENLIPKSEPKPLRIWLQVSDKDNGHTRDAASMKNWTLSNQRMAAVLKAKGYHYNYVFSEASGHNDGKVLRATLPDALVWLWRGYPIQ